MLAWTALTLAAGWFAVSGAGLEDESPGGAQALGGGVIATVEATARPATRTVEATARPATRTAVSTTRTPLATRTGEASVTPGASPAAPTPGLKGIPEYAQPAGIEGSVADVGRKARVQDVSAQAPKGVIVLDPGHGRGDPGAVHHRADGSVDVTEAESNLRNAILLRNELVSLGYDVYLTRDDAGRAPDGDLVPQFIVNDLFWRVQLASAVDADVYLALHGNGAVVPSISGPETWYCGKHEQGSSNARLAAMVQRAMMDALHEYGYFPPDRGIMEDAARHHSGDFCQFVVTRETEVPAALLEFLFLTNDDDARVLADDRSHALLARHLANALDGFLTERPESRPGSRSGAGQLD
jgi:N-acetylmuramoyl-L-alanine amidase